jgi:hypothetical protein
MMTASKLEDFSPIGSADAVKKRTSILDATQVSIEVSGLEVFALKKLSLVSHALASKFDDFKSREEQKCLAGILDDVIRRIEIATASAKPIADEPCSEGVNS